jgi:hypothetical protein
MVAASAAAQALADPQLVHRLDRPVTLAWSGQRLGPALDRLAEAQKIAVWLDRRVDPSTAVELAATDERLGDVLARLAEAQQLGAVPFQAVVYVGPRQTSDELATLAARLRDSLAAAPPEVRARWLKTVRWSYPRLSEPRGLLRELLAPTGASVRGDELIPHDLWPARSLPPLSVADRTVLLLAGFDLAGELSPRGEALQVVAIKRPVEVTRGYSSRARRQAEFQQVLSALPSDRIQERGGRLEVAARWEDHQRLQAALRPRAPGAPPARSQPSGGGDRRFTLAIENQPVKRVVDQLAERLKLNVVWASAPPPADEALVSCDVRDADLDGLLKAILGPANLAHSRDGSNITIRPAK